VFLTPIYVNFCNFYDIPNLNNSKILKSRIFMQNDRLEKVAKHGLYTESSSV
jgi:hypothetical protein